MHWFHKFILAWNSTCFGQFLCPSSGVYSLYTKQWYMSYTFVDSFRAGPRWNLLGVSCFSPHILIYLIAAFVLYNFSLLFLYWYVSFAFLALTNFTFVWPCIVTNFFIMKPTRCIHPSCSTARQFDKPVWHIPLLSLWWINSWWWTEELSETCRVSCQNKFVKLVHLVGFIIEKYEGWLISKVSNCIK